MKNKISMRMGNLTPPPHLRKFLTSLKALTLLLVMLLSANVWGTEAALENVSTKNVVETKGESVSMTFGDVTCNVTRNSGNQPGFYTSSGIVRYYSTDVMTLSVPSGSTISKIVFVMNSGTVGTASPEGLSSDSKTWTGSANSVSFTGSATVKITSITVTYSGDTPDPTEPSLAVSPKTIDFGTVYQKADVAAQQVTVTFSNLTADDVGANTNDLTTFVIDKYGPFTSGDKITITPVTYGLGKYEETLILFSETDGLEEMVTITMNVVEAPAPFDGNTWELLKDDFSTNSYSANDGSHTKDGVSYNTKDVMQSSSSIQIKKSTGKIYNENNLGKIAKIEITKTGSNNLLVYATDEANPSSLGTDISGSVSGDVTTYTFTGTHGFFVIKGNSTAASNVTPIKVYYTPLKYAITLATCENGEVSVTGATDLSSVASGTEITLSNTPASGYTLDEYDVYKTGESTTKVTIEGGKFKMPAYPVTVSATFKAAKVLNSVEITTPASKTEYWVGDAFTSEGLVVTAHFASGDEVVTPTSITTPDMTTAGEKTITVSFTEGATTKSDEYTITVKAIENTKETAYTVAEAIALIDANPTGLATAKVYVKGTISQVDNFNPTYKSITYWLGGNSFEVYSGKGLDNADFASIDDVVVGAEVIVYGVIKKYTQSGKPDVYEFDKNNYLVSYVAPENPKTTAIITLSGYVTSLSTDDAANEVTIEYNGDGELSASSSNTGFATAAIVEGKLVVTPIAVGSVTITVSAPETDEYTAATKSYNLTVSAGLTAAVLPFEFDDGKNDINPANGIKADGLGTDYSASPKLKFDGDGDYVLVKIASKAAQVSYKIKGAPGSGDWSGQFDVLESADGTTYTTVASHTALEKNVETKTHDLLEGTRYIKFVLTTKDNGNVGLGAINIVATKPKVDPEFSIANVDVVVEDEAALQITTNSDGAVTYTIEPNNEGIEIDGDVVHAFAEGTYTVTANKAETETYNAAQTTFTVTVSSVAYKTAEVSTFTAIDGGLLELGQFHSYKGDAGTAPVINNNHIRLYQIGSGKSSGGYITISALPGLKIAKIDISTATATSYNYKVDAAEDYTLTEATALAANATANLAGLSADSVRIYCLGADNKSRFDVSYLKVYYTGELETVSALAVDGAEVTEYEIGDEVDHTGAVVTATFTSGDVDVTLNSTFTDPDMSTSGTKQVTANFAEQTATYDITVAAETPEIEVDVTSVGFGTVAQNAEVDAKTVAVTLKAVTEATVAVTGEGASAFNVTPTSLTESGNITITPVTTTAGEFTATITISADGADAQEVTLSMIVEAPDVCDGTDDFETSENTSASSYTERSTTTGWSAVNAARTKIVEDIFFTINGKTSAVGVITSPELEDGIASLKIRYANTFQEANGVSFRVDIKQNEEVVKTYTITKANDDVAQNTVYTETISDINVAGTFQIVITNLSPTNSTSNKDRLSIGRLCWTAHVPEPQYETIRDGLTIDNYGTICYPRGIEAGNYKGAIFFSISYKDVENSLLIADEVTTSLKAGRPYIFLATDTKIQAILNDDEVDEPNNMNTNGLYGVFEKFDITEENTGDIYLLSSNVIRNAAAGSWLAANRAYIKLGEVSTAVVEQAPGRRRMVASTPKTTPTSMEEIFNAASQDGKFIINGQLFIFRDGKVFNAQGALVK